MASPMPGRKRSVVYVDGFNLYYGAVKGSPHKWLDLQRYFEILRPHDDIQAIRYFTALIDGPRSKNQLAYLRALETLPLMEIVLGQFKMKQVTCQVKVCTLGGARRFTTQEEKRTDVNIAVRMLDDAYQDVCERFVLVSGDSDLVPAVNLVKTRFPRKEVIVYVPARSRVRGAAVELRGAADKHRILPLEKLVHAQFPARVADGSGGVIEKPADW
jgi:uncharacterized LabA/DUF88 family protein